jgi:hypothetical protein
MSVFPCKVCGQELLNFVSQLYLHNKEHLVAQYDTILTTKIGLNFCITGTKNQLNHQTSVTSGIARLFNALGKHSSWPPLREITDFKKTKIIYLISFHVSIV